MGMLIGELKMMRQIVKERKGDGNEIKQEGGQRKRARQLCPYNVFTV